MDYLYCYWSRYTFSSENPVEELQTKGENVKVKENEKSATEINGYHKISLIWLY